MGVMTGFLSDTKMIWPGAGMLQRKDQLQTQRHDVIRHHGFLDLYVVLNCVDRKSLSGHRLQVSIGLGPAFTR